MAILSKGNYIGGQWILGHGQKFSSIDPAHGEEIWTGHYANKSDINSAVKSARNAFESWSKLEVSKRLGFLQTFANILNTKKDALATLISSEIGKPRWESLTEVTAMIGKLEPTIQAYHERNNNTSRQLTIGVSQTRFKPHGIIAVLGPYNFPGHMPNGHIMPALLAGNTIIFKPSEKAPAVAELIVEYWMQSGLPLGVLNLIQGESSIGKQLCEHKGINGIFFTGSLRTGEAIRGSTSVDKILALEMGGNSPLIVWDASDINAAVFATIQSAFITAGQRCSSARRLIVPDNKFGQIFLAHLAKSVQNISIGSYNMVPEPYMGPLRLPSMVDYILSEQEKLISLGAIPIIKSKRLSLGNTFITPGIIDVTGVSQRSDEEIIGPFVQVVRAKNFDLALEEANKTKYGLAAGLFTEDQALFNRFQEVIQAGILTWNQQLTGASAWAPFGGIKYSGNHRPSGYLASDYCVYSTGSIELSKLALPSNLPPGLSLTK